MLLLIFFLFGDWIWSAALQNGGSSHSLGDDRILAIAHGVSGEMMRIMMAAVVTRCTSRPLHHHHRLSDRFWEKKRHRGIHRWFIRQRKAFAAAIMRANHAFTPEVPVDIWGLTHCELIMPRQLSIYATIRL